MSRSSTSVLPVLLALAVTAESASATLPGDPGRIAFVTAPATKASKEFPGNGRIVSTLPDGRGLQPIRATAGASLSDAEYAPGGARIAWTASARRRGNGVFVGAVEGGPAKQLVRSAWIDGITWSPDAKTLVYNDVRSGLHAIPADGSGPPKLLVKASGSGNLRQPVFSPDGATIAFERITIGSGMGPAVLERAELLQVRADGSGLSSLIPASVVPKFAGEPDFSPDGTSITFVGSDEGERGRQSVFVVRRDGSGLRAAFTAPKGRWIDGPTWAPDGSGIAVTTGGTPQQGSSLLRLDPVNGGSTVLRRVRTGWMTDVTWQSLATQPAAGAAGVAS